MIKNKMIKALLCLGLFTSLVACGSSTKKGEEEFSKLADTIPAILFENTSFDINFLFDQPEDFGIEREIYELEYTTYEQFKKNDKKFEKAVASLKDYDYQSLTKDQQITYDLLAQEEDVEVAQKAYYYLSTNYFSASNGVQASLPFSLWNFEFKNQKSVDSFLHVLQTCSSVFDQYVKHEEKRQKEGYGMSQSYMDSVIENVNTINTSSQQYILDATYTKVDAISFLSNEEKQIYKDAVTDAFNNAFLPAFQKLETDLQQVEIKTKGEGALKDYKEGKDYYASIVLSSSGFSTMDEYDSYLDEQESKYINLMIEILQKDETLLERIQKDDYLSSIQYTDATSTQEVLASLEEIINSGKDFPTIQALEYEMFQIPESMKKTTTAVASYYISAFDDTSGKGETMIFNGEFDQTNYSTIAHEGFPGHMYQHNYFKSVPHHIIRNILGASAYLEGWATYIQGEMIPYTKSPVDAQLSYINSMVSYISILRIDKKIHYDGISKEEVLKIFATDYGIEDEEVLLSQYNQLLQNPGVFINYYVGAYRILDLKDEAKKAWKNKYSDKRFHKAILELGPLPLDLLDKYMREKI